MDIMSSIFLVELIDEEDDMSPYVSFYSLIEEVDEMIQRTKTKYQSTITDTLPRKLDVGDIRELEIVPNRVWIQVQKVLKKYVKLC
jgi:hypothetical protein